MRMISKFEVHDIPEDEMRAFAQFLKRMTYEDCGKFANKRETYSHGQKEQDVMWSAICIMMRALADAGFAPR